MRAPKTPCKGKGANGVSPWERGDEALGGRGVREGGERTHPRTRAQPGVSLCDRRQAVDLLLVGGLRLGEVVQLLLHRRRLAEELAQRGRQVALGEREEGRLQLGDRALKRVSSLCGFGERVEECAQLRLEGLELLTALVEVLQVPRRQLGPRAQEEREGMRRTSSNSVNLGPEILLLRLARKPLCSAVVSILRCLICERRCRASGSGLDSERGEAHARRCGTCRSRGRGAGRGRRRASGATRSC